MQLVYALRTGALPLLAFPLLPSEPLMPTVVIVSGEVMITSCGGDPLEGVNTGVVSVTPLKFAVITVVVFIKKDGHGFVVPLHAALPDAVHPVNVDPPVAVAVHGPTLVPDVKVPVAQFVPVTVPVPVPAVDTVMFNAPVIRGCGYV
jgi:hypothetical protein